MIHRGDGVAEACVLQRFVRSAAELPVCFRCGQSRQKGSKGVLEVVLARVWEGKVDVPEEWMEELKRR